MKRIFSICLAIILLLSCFAGTVPVKAATSAYIYSFSQFKDAMEDESITDVYLYDADDDIFPRYPQRIETEPAITMVGTKKLHLRGKAIFRVQENPTEEYVKYHCLLLIPEGASLTIDGNGYLGFCSHWDNLLNAAIANKGTLVIHSGTIAGEYDSANDSRAIWHGKGSMTIYGGNFNGASIKENEDPNKAWWSAVRVDAPASIRGGNFFCHHYGFGNAKSYGLMLTSSASISITGGIYKNIYLPNTSIPLSDYVPETHTVLVDGQWINADSEYSQDYVEKALVRVVNWIKEAKVTIKAPTDGATLDYGPVSAGEGYYIHVPQWYQDGVLLDRYTAPVAVPGASYKVEIPLITEDYDSFEFASGSNLSGFVNGSSAQISQNGSYKMEKSVLLTMEFGTCKSSTDQVLVSIDEPRDGHTISFSADVTNSELCDVVNNSVVWYEDDQPVSKGSVFQAGKEYSVSLQVEANRSGEFPVDEWGEPNAYGRVNGYDAQVFPVEGQDPGQIIELRFDFGIVNDTVIEEIAVTDIITPVVGEYPSYTCTLLGTGYHLDTDWDSNVIHNGIGWWDVTGDNWIYPDETFVAGHEYQVGVYVQTDEGYEFYTTGRYMEPAGTAVINGSPASMANQSLANLEQKVRCSFPCQPRKIKNVEVIGLDAPVDGSTPDFSATTDLPEYYTVDSIDWYDDNMDEMAADAVFVAGVRYRVVIKVVPVQVNDAYTCKFIDGRTTASVDGNPVVRTAEDWDEVSAGPKKITIFYSFAPAPVHGNANITGDVFSFGDDADEILLQLIPQGTTEVAYETYSWGTAAPFSLSCIPEGNYILRVIKSYHATREYDLEVGRSSMLQDVSLQLIGDLTGDGKLTVADVSKAYAHAKKSNLLSGYDFQVADITGDGKVNTADVSRAYAHAKKTAVLW